MILSDLHLTHFKNHSEGKFNFLSGINCVVGKNGKGKTNLLDAVNYLAFGRTSLSSTDAQNITHDQKAFYIHGTFADDLKVACGYEFRKGKMLKVNGSDQPKISEHVGLIPLVMTSPDDSDLIREGSEFRRRFFDGAISQVDKEYLTVLMTYQRALRQRNEHLKAAVNGPVDHRLLDTYDQVIVDYGVEIARKRKAFVEEFLTSLDASYRQVHQSAESPDVEYNSEALEENFKKNYRASRDRDIIMQRTLMGIHRDKYEFMLNEQQIMKFGSQGQQKTFIIALRLAEYDLIRQKLSKYPLLLLDDIFDKLDDDRIGRLVELLSDKERFEQIFITDARKERSRSFFNEKKVNFVDL